MFLGVGFCQARQLLESKPYNLTRKKLKGGNLKGSAMGFVLPLCIESTSFPFCSKILCNRK